MNVPRQYMSPGSGVVAHERPDIRNGHPIGAGRLFDDAIQLVNYVVGEGLKGEISAQGIRIIESHDVELGVRFKGGKDSRYNLFKVGAEGIQASLQTGLT